MKGIGKMISNMEMDLNHGQMAPNMKDSTFQVKNMELEDLHGLMEVHFMVILLIITLKEKVNIIGQMAENLTVIG